MAASFFSTYSLPIASPPPQAGGRIPEIRLIR
jgi:hypothetical protein